MLANLTELRKHRVQGTRDVYLSLPPDAVANSPILSSSESVTLEREENLREYYDRYSR